MMIQQGSTYTHEHIRRGTTYTDKNITSYKSDNTVSVTDGNVKCVNLYQGVEKAQPAQQKDHIPIMTYTVLLVLTLMQTYNEIPK